MSDTGIYGLTVATAPAAEIISTTNAKLWLRVDTSADDSLIDSLVIAARQNIESWCNITLVNTTYTYTLDCWPDCPPVIYLPRWSDGDESAVASIYYLNSAGDSTLWASSNYVVDANAPSARIARADGVSWPTLANRIAPITITYTTGFGAAATDVPAAILTAAKLMIADMYEHRAAAFVGTIRTDNPTVANLLEFYHTRNVAIGAY